MKKLAIAITAASLAIGLTGCSTWSGNSTIESGNSANKAEIAAAEEMSKHPMPGFALNSIGYGDRDCVWLGPCNTNATVNFTTSKRFDSRPQFCKDLISWLPSIGADAWGVSDIPLPLKGHEGAATFSCIGVEYFRFFGTIKDVRWQLECAESYLNITASSDDFEDDKVLETRGWDEAFSLMSPGNRLNMEALSAIETYRLANPKANPSSTKTIEKALKDVQLPKGSKLVKDKSGKVHYLYLPKDENLLERCINVTPFDTEYFQIENPGSGFIALPVPDGQAVIDEFGYTDFKACPTL